MFHGKDDIRVLRSAELLYQGLMKNLRVKPLQSVTVFDVSKASTVSRATFYRSFDDISDVLAWKCDREFHDMLTTFIESEPDLNKSNVLLTYVLRHWMQPERLELLEQLMNNNRLDIVYAGFVNNATIVLDYLHEHDIPMDADDYVYFISLKAGVFVGIMKAWITTGKRESAEEVADIVCRQFAEASDANLVL